MKASRIQQALKILNASAEEIIVAGMSKPRKSAARKKTKKAVKKPAK
jgi:hypothetical protein